MRILILIAIGLLLYTIIANLLFKKRALLNMSTVEMVRCGHCGMHVSKKESVHSEDSFYCSSEHFDEHHKVNE